MGELGGDGERKTEIARERCKYIPGKHTQTKTTMIQKKLMLGSHKLQNPIFLTILMHFPPRPHPNQSLSNRLSHDLIPLFRSPVADWGQYPCLRPHPPAPGSLLDRHDRGVGLPAHQ